MRMRAKTVEFLKVLNRAHIEHPTNTVINTNITTASGEPTPISPSVNKIGGIQSDNMYVIMFFCLCLCLCVCLSARSVFLFLLGF